MSKLFDVLKQVPYSCNVNIVVFFTGGSTVKFGFKTNSTAAKVRDKILAEIELDLKHRPELAEGSMAALLALFENANFIYRREWRTSYHIELNKDVSGIAGVKSIKVKIKPTFLNNLIRKRSFDRVFFKV